MNYHNKRFKVVSNTENGEVSAALIFHYKQSDNVLSCEYKGGEIIHGHLIGLVDKEGIIEMRYHQVNNNGELMTGTCRSEPQMMENGKIRLVERWQWTSGEKSKGHSILEEI